MQKSLAISIFWLAIGSTGLAQVQSLPDDDNSTRRQARTPSEKDDKPLAMTRAVACRSIDGFEQYEPLPGGALTADEKLQVYYRPLNYSTSQEGEVYRVHLIQDGQIRRKGEKAVLRSKKNILEYEPKSREPLGTIFLKNSVPLKGLPPGDYEYDIILRDENRPGPPVLQSLKFRIVRAELPGAKQPHPKRNAARNGSAYARRRPTDQREGDRLSEFFFDLSDLDDESE
jgi:hypothetical protein